MFLRGLLALVGLTIALSVQASAQTPPVENYVQIPAMRSVTLSPSGRYAAYLRDIQGSDQLVIVDLSTNEHRSIQAVREGTDDLLWVDWKTDDRLVFGLRNEMLMRGETETGRRTGGTQDRTFRRWRVFGINRDGGNVVQMFGEQIRQLADNYGSTFLADMLPMDSQQILLIATDNFGVGVWQADVTTGRVTRVTDGSFSTVDYTTDGVGQPVMRIDTLASGAGYRVLRRASGARDWVTHLDVRGLATTTNSPDFLLVGPGPGANQVYVLARPDNRDRLALYLMRTDTGELGAPLQEGQNADVAMPWIHPVTREVFAQCEYFQRLQCSTPDRSVNRHLRAVASFLGEGVTVTQAGISQDANVWLLYASGAGEPGAYYVYNRAAASMEPLGAVYRNAGSDLSPTEVVEYAARDGTRLWAYVTARPGTGPRPMIVMPHGGPESRDYLEYDAYAQFLASRGYVVVQPNFRGSFGFGRAFGDAGRGQWGRLMQDDVTDAVQHLVSSGVADPQRICIVGASYGGYSALAGVALTPDLYRCAISIAGVADLARMLRTERIEDGANSMAYRYWQRSIGDINANRDAILAASPSELADRIQAPVLLIHGEEDETVLVEQSQIMDRALRDAGKNVRFVRLEEADHYWSNWSSEDRLTLLRESERFLAQHLGPAN